MAQTELGSINQEGNITITNPDDIMQVFHSAMHSVLGISNSVTPFDAKVLYPTDIDLSYLAHPFTMEELDTAVT